MSARKQKWAARVFLVTFFACLAFGPLYSLYRAGTGKHHWTIWPIPHQTHFLFPILMLAVWIGLGLGCLIVAIAIMMWWDKTGSKATKRKWRAIWRAAEWRTK